MTSTRATENGSRSGGVATVASRRGTISAEETSAPANWARAESTRRVGSKSGSGDRAGAPIATRGLGAPPPAVARAVPRQRPRVRDSDTVPEMGADPHDHHPGRADPAGASRDGS